MCGVLNEFFIFVVVCQKLEFVCMVCVVGNVQISLVGMLNGLYGLLFGIRFEIGVRLFVVGLQVCVLLLRWLMKLFVIVVLLFFQRLVNVCIVLVILKLVCIFVFRCLVYGDSDDVYVVLFVQIVLGLLICVIEVFGMVWFLFGYGFSGIFVLVVGLCQYDMFWFDRLFGKLEKFWFCVVL